MFEEIRARHFPVDIRPNITIRSVTLESFLATTNKLSAQIFSPNTALGLYERGKRSDQQLQLRNVHVRHADYVVIYEGETPIGFSFGEQLDADTYCMRWTGIVPTHQRKGLYTAFLDKLIPYLREIGYERVNSNHMANNRAVLIAKLKAGFNITSLELDERHGAIVWVTRYLSPERYEGFRSAFSLEHYTQSPPT